MIIARPLYQELVLRYGRLLIDLCDYDDKHPLEPPSTSSALMMHIKNVQDKISKNYSDNPDIDFYKFAAVKSNGKKYISIIPFSLLVLPLARLIYKDEECIFRTALCRVIHWANRDLALCNSYKWLDYLLEVDLLKRVDVKSASPHISINRTVVDTFFADELPRKKTRKKYADRFKIKFNDE